jgi:two-component system sensor histidine kinase RegB
MGLGLFIAKTLLERTGATLAFANGGEVAASEATGAIVTVTWPRSIARDQAAARGPLGRNAPIYG